MEPIYIALLVLIIGCAAAVIRDYFLDPQHYGRICRSTKKFTSCYRRLFRSSNWEKLSLLVLAICPLLVAILTLIGTWGTKIDRTKNIDYFVFESLRVAFSVFEWDSYDFRGHTDFIPILPEILSVLTPLSTLGTALTLIWSFLPHHVPCFSRVWYLFSELDPNSIRMARSIHRELEKTGDTGVFIFLRTRRGKQSQDVLDELKDLNYFFYPKNEQRFLFYPWRRRRILQFFFLTENTDENFNQLQDFLTAAGRRKLLKPMDYSLQDGQFQHELYLLSETESAPMLIDHLRGSLKNKACKDTFRNTDLRLLDRFRAVSYDLLSRQPLYRFQQDNQLNILVLGFGRIGREFFRAAWSMGVLPGCTTKFTICDQEIVTKLRQFNAEYPELYSPEHITQRSDDIDTCTPEDLIGSNVYHYIVVALGDDERNIRVASRLKRYYRRRHWEDPATIQPQICVNIEDAVKHAYTKSLWDAKQAWDKPIHPFGGLDQAFTKDVLMPVNLWAAARQIHRLVNGAMDAKLHLWSEYERRSSIASAAHTACYMAHLCGKDWLEKKGELSGQYREAWNALPEETHSMLFTTEHNRWMAYVRGEGMQCASEEILDAYFPALKTHVDTLGRLTPCLVEVSKLQNVQNHVNQLREQYPPENPPAKQPFPFRYRDKLIVMNAAAICEILHPEKASGEPRFIYPKLDEDTKEAQASAPSA